MKIINRYLTREVYTTMLAVIVVLLLIFLSQQFVRYMHYAAAGNLPAQNVKLLLLLQLPILSAVLLPASLFFAILMAYGRLYADSEMTIFTACGVSPLHLLKITFGFSAVVMIVVATLTLWINPMIYNYSDRILSGAITKSALEMVKPNSFTPIAKEKLIFYVADTSSGKKHLSQVFAAEQPTVNNLSEQDKNKLSVIVAKSVHQEIDKQTGDLYIVLSDGYRYVGVPGKRDYEIIKYDEYAVQVQQDVGSWQGDASSTSTLKLWQMRQDKLSAAELHWRLALPLSALILALLGTSLSKIKPRTGRYAKIIPAILLYITYANFLFLAKTWLKKGVLSPIWGMWWVHGIMLLITVFLIYQQMGSTFSYSYFKKLKNNK